MHPCWHPKLGREERTGRAWGSCGAEVSTRAELCSPSATYWGWDLRVLLGWCLWPGILPFFQALVPGGPPSLVKLFLLQDPSCFPPS